MPGSRIEGYGTSRAVLSVPWDPPASSQGQRGLLVSGLSQGQRALLASGLSQGQRALLASGLSQEQRALLAIPPRVVKHEPSSSVREVGERYDAIVTSPSRVRAQLTGRELHELYWRTARHPVAQLAALPDYDPTGLVGFCFGRAMTARLLAAQMGLAPEAVRSLFIVGDLRSGDEPEWRFHVTATIRGPDGWVAIDPALEALGVMGPLPVGEWVEIVRQVWDHPNDSRSPAKLYWTQEGVVTPDLRRAVPVKEETGENLLELSFDPTRSRGFETAELAGETVFVPDDEASRRYFTRVHEPEGGFDFHGVTINERHFDFYGYFDDLLASLVGASAVRFRGMPLSSSAVRDAGGRRSMDATRFTPLASMRWDALVKGTSALRC